MSVGASELLVEGEATVDAIELASGEISARSPLSLFWRRFRQDRVSMVSAGFIVLLILVAIFAPLIVKLLGLPGPADQNPNLTDAFGTPIGPTGAHPFGVDGLGEDVMSRTIYGARVSLLVGILGTGLATLVGVTMGLFAGFYRGWTDTVLSRIADIVLSFPILLLGIGIAAACAVNGCLGGTIQPGVQTIIVIIVISGWTYIFRITRGQVLSLREKEFVEASRSLGASNMRIMFREILPEPRRSDHRLRQPADPDEHPVRGGAVVPRRRRQTADRELGPDDRGRVPGILPGRVVVHAVPGSCVAADGPGLQPRR